MARLTPEKKYERAFMSWCSERDMKAIKGPTANSGGFPDRFVQLRCNGGTIYVEFKGTSDYDLTPRQVWWKHYIKASSPHRYFVVDSPESLEYLKYACEILMEIGPELVAYERELIIKAKEKRTL